VRGRTIAVLAGDQTGQELLLEALRVLDPAVIGLEVGGLLAGAVITETIFAWTGVGRWVVDAITDRDYFIIQSSILIFALIFLVVNLGVDILYAYLNPRIRYA